MDYKTEAQPKATAGEVPVFCAHDAIVAIEKLIPNPKNPNTHPDAQIQALGRIIRQTGWRAPITVSKRSGFIVKGHGRLAAAKLEGNKFRGIHRPYDFIRALDSWNLALKRNRVSDVHPAAEVLRPENDAFVLGLRKASVCQRQRVDPLRQTD